MFHWNFVWFFVLYIFATCREEKENCVIIPGIDKTIDIWNSEKLDQKKWFQKWSRKYLFVLNVYNCIRKRYFCIVIIGYMRGILFVCLILIVIIPFCKFRPFSFFIHFSAWFFDFCSFFVLSILKHLISIKRYGGWGTGG